MGVGVEEALGVVAGVLQHAVHLLVEAQAGRISGGHENRGVSPEPLKGLLAVRQ